MGITNYFKAGKKAPAPKAARASRLMTEKIPEENEDSPTFDEKDGPFGGPAVSGVTTPLGIDSSRASVMTDVNKSSSFMDDIKHEVMVNYLFQQQCARLWVGDGSGEVEGVLLRKFRGNYLACPPALSQSVFAMACAALNVQVRLVNTTI